MTADVEAMSVRWIAIGGRGRRQVMKDNDTRLFTVLLVMGLAALSLVIRGHSSTLTADRATMSSLQRSQAVHRLWDVEVDSRVRTAGSAPGDVTRR
jgi:hypothetical protein